MEIRDRILKAAAQVYADAGFLGATTRRVATEAGVNEITLFRQFGSKEQLIKAAIESLHRELQPPVLPEPTDPEAELTAWANTWLDHWYRHRDLIARLMGDMVEHPEIAPSFCEEPSQEHAVLSRYLARLRELGLASGDWNPEAAAGLLLGSIFTHAMWRDHMPAGIPPREVVVGEFVRLLLRAVGARTVRRERV